MSKMYVLTESLAFEIAGNDMPMEMEWEEALNAATNFGDRWRLPTDDELDLMYRLHKKGVGNFKNENYWSSEGTSNYSFSAISFITGTYHGGVSSKAPIPKYLARLVRNI